MSYHSVKNNFSTTLATAITTTGQLTISLTTDPAISYPYWLTIGSDTQVTAGTAEIVEVTALGVIVRAVQNTTAQTWVLGTKVQINETAGHFSELQQDKVITFSIPGDAFVKTNFAGWRADKSYTIKTVKIYSDTAPVGANLIAEINKNGTTIFTTQTNRPTITAGTNAGTDITTIEVNTLVAGDRLTLDIDQIGSTTAGGNNLLVTVVLRP